MTPDVRPLQALIEYAAPYRWRRPLRPQPDVDGSSGGRAGHSDPTGDTVVDASRAELSSAVARASRVVAAYALHSNVRSGAPASRPAPSLERAWADLSQAIDAYETAGG